MIINYQYILPYEPVLDYEFKSYNPLVNTTTYKPIIEEQIPFVIESLNTNQGSRQGVIIINKGIQHNSCIISLQFQYYLEILFVTCMFRSQSEVYGRPSDSRLINQIITQVKNGLHYKIKSVCTNVYVGNYHHTDGDLSK